MTDPFDLIRRGDPAPRAQMPGAASPVGVAIRQRVLARVEAPPPPRPSRRVVLRALLLAALTLALVAAGWLAWRDASDPRGVGCYEAPDTTADVVVVAGTGGAAACAELWEHGVLANPAVAGVPGLVACVTEAGGIAVFPSDDADLCGRLGIDGYEPSAGGVPGADLNDALLAFFAAGRCIEMEEARLAVERIVATADPAWDVAVGAATDDRPCASFSLDGTASTVRLVPIPEPPSR